MTSRALDPVRWADLWVADPLAVAVIAGAIAVVRARRRTRAPDRPRDRWLLAGATAAVLALVSPVGGLSGELFAAHMVQHLVLLFVAAPAIAMGDPGPAMLATLPPRGRAAALRAWRRLPAAFRRPGAGIALGAAASAVALWVWHAPSLYGAAVRAPALHVLEHAVLLLPAVVFWGGVARRRTRHRQVLLVTVLASALLVMQGGVLAAILVFAGDHLYPVYDATHRWGLTPLEDQRLAGTLLWVVGGPAYALAAVAAVVRGLHASEEHRPSAAGRAGAPPAGHARR